ncbi:bifunctional tRNA (5-methylaminomethyl-2-thiouridine)(34)-methyltransferase MnmD/FAD-dependent 5-carboxymethylaminomethyl-2-thiouridine(34) oxidoreductase MnmC, partial [Salmonella enterica subsp. enterica serovar Infantis]
GQDSNNPNTPPNTALGHDLCNDGYLTPQKQTNHQHSNGASYQRGDESTFFSEEDHRQNRKRLLDCCTYHNWAT